MYIGICTLCVAIGHFLPVEIIDRKLSLVESSTISAERSFQQIRRDYFCELIRGLLDDKSGFVYDQQTIRDTNHISQLLRGSDIKVRLRVTVEDHKTLVHRIEGISFVDISTGRPTEAISGRVAGVAYKVRLSHTVDLIDNRSNPSRVRFSLTFVSDVVEPAKQRESTLNQTATDKLSIVAK